MNNRMVQYMAEQLSPYQGYKFSGVADDGEGTIGLILSSGKKKVVLWVLRDPEGNGPGYVEIQEAND